MSDNQQTPATESPAATKPTSPQKGPTINFPKLLDLCGGILGQVFFKIPQEKSKELFDELKKGKSPVLGNVNLGETIKLDLKVTLDRKEFVGRGFNFNVFQIALKNLLDRIGSTLKIKADLNLRTSQQGGVLVGFAGVTTVGEQHNTLMMALDMGTQGEVNIRLMFVDPSQFGDAI